MQLSPISLAITRLGGVRFSPSALFATGALGAWYDPSDSTTIFEDTAGTTPSPTPGAGALSVVGRMLDKSGNGNHAISYNTTTARPELSARVNLLTYSEQFDNGVWTKSNVTVSANHAVAPNGTTTADLLYPTTSGNDSGAYQAVTVAAGINLTQRIWVKAAGFNFVAFTRFSGAGYAAWVDLTTGTASNVAVGYSASTVSDSGGWWVTLTGPASATSYVQPTCADAAGSIAATTNGTNGIYIWGADLRPANIGTSVPAYQRIADAYTYDSSGFPRYLVFNGTASGMYTPANLNLSGTDKATVFAGVRKLSDAALGVVAEFSAGIATNNGSFLLSAPNSAAANYNFSSKGTTQVDNTVTTYTAPISNVVTGQGNISAPSNVIRVNGTQAGSVVTTQGTGNYGTFALNLGARNAQSGTPTVGTFFNGYLYSAIVVGAASTAAQISSTESWINVKEGGVY